jgi:hypothetical protein
MSIGEATAAAAARDTKAHDEETARVAARLATTRAARAAGEPAPSRTLPLADRRVVTRIGPSPNGVWWNAAILWRDRLAPAEDPFFFATYDDITRTAPRVPVGRSDVSDALRVTWDTNEARLETHRLGLGGPPPAGHPSTEYRFFAKLQQGKLAVPSPLAVPLPWCMSVDRLVYIVFLLQPWTQVGWAH